MNIFIYVFVWTPVILIIAVILIELWRYSLLKRIQQTAKRMCLSMEEDIE